MRAHLRLANLFHSTPTFLLFLCLLLLPSTKFCLQQLHPPNPTIFWSQLMEWELTWQISTLYTLLYDPLYLIKIENMTRKHPSSDLPLENPFYLQYPWSDLINTIYYSQSKLCHNEVQQISQINCPFRCV